jgi:hypothetical protein
VITMRDHRVVDEPHRAPWFVTASYPAIISTKPIWIVLQPSTRACVGQRQRKTALCKAACGRPVEAPGIVEGHVKHCASCHRGCDQEVGALGEWAHSLESL